jgi:hypothetical protein
MTELFGVTPWALRGSLLLFLGVFGVLSAGSLSSEASLWIEIVALACVSAAAVWITLPGASPWAGRATAGVLLLSGAAAGVRFFQVLPHAVSPFAHWHVAAITFVLLGLMLRGRACWAWLGFAVLAGLTISGTVTAGLGAEAGIALVIRQGGTLLMGHLMALGLHRSGRAIAAFNAQRALDEAAEMTRLSTLDERRAQLNRVNAMSRPVLEQLAAGDAALADVPTAAAFPPALLAQCRLVEASLRDAMRGRALFREPVITAARQARQRGVEVFLLDDSGDEPPANMDAVAWTVTGELSILQRGRLTARVWPAGRASIASIVIEVEPALDDSLTVHDSLTPAEPEAVSVPRYRLITIDAQGVTRESSQA